MAPCGRVSATMTSLPCPLPGRDASNVVFPDLAPVPSVVAAYPLGLSTKTAASPDLSYSQPYGHLLPYSYPEPTTSGDAYLPSQQLLAAWSQPFHPPVEHPQELETEQWSGKFFLVRPLPGSNEKPRTPGARIHEQKKLLKQNFGEQKEDFSERPPIPCLPAPQIFHPSGVYPRLAPCLPVAMTMALEPGISSPDVRLLPQML
ncbi:hypothetical protein U0070_022531 [Myodes glareolus]|uniref:Homeobox protein DLX-4 n=1 Tax=Myodes glareolus TaxID=447135 RepID=A0AAW0H1V8_MYOGA